MIPKTPLTVKKRLMFMFIVFELLIAALVVRVFWIQAFDAQWLQPPAYEQHTRDRLISPDRGQIFDRNGVVIAATETVCSVSVIRAQIKDANVVASVLSERLDMDRETILEKCKKRVALERIKTKVDKETADGIRALGIPGIVIDEDIRRVYPFSTLAAQVIGFVGRDNQGIVGLEAKYDASLKGSSGKILTQTDAGGVNVKNGDILRQEPIDGKDLYTSLDVVVQRYAEQTIQKSVQMKDAKRGLIIVMNPQNGEIYAIANEPTFDLNEPFTINNEELAAVWSGLTDAERMSYLNQMWRNFAINDTYEPGSTFKVITSAAGLEDGVVNVHSSFVCSGGTTVGGRYIKCWRSPRSHGSLNFVEGVQNSCNPVFMAIGERLGPERFYDYMKLFEFNKKTGIDLPGEAVGIMHKLENVGPVELATMSFGQSFQITPMQLLRAVSATINGGNLITPHVAVRHVDKKTKLAEEIAYPRQDGVISKETSDIMRETLESVVEVGTGNRSYIAGYRIGGKTATSEKLPRGNGKYIASFLSFAPAEKPQVVALVLIDEPQGAYYGGQVAGPVMRELLQTVLPYLGIAPEYSEKELSKKGVGQISVPDVSGQTPEQARKTIETLGLKADITGDGHITTQFPKPGEMVNYGSLVICTNLK